MMLYHDGPPRTLKGRSVHMVSESATMDTGSSLNKVTDVLRSDDSSDECSKDYETIYEINWIKWNSQHKWITIHD